MVTNGRVPQSNCAKHLFLYSSMQAPHHAYRKKKHLALFTVTEKPQFKALRRHAQHRKRPTHEEAEE